MAKKSLFGIQRKQLKRLNIQLTVKAGFEINGTAGEVYLKSRNISQSGICLEADQGQVEALNILSNTGTASPPVLHLEIELPNEQTPVKFKGNVCWYDISAEKSPYSYQIGIAFIEQGQKEYRILKNFLKKNRENHGFFKRIFSIA